MAQARSHFLSQKDEWFMLSVPWIGALLALAYYLQLHSAASPVKFDSELLALATGLLFVDGIHVIYTLVLLRALPELKEWSSVVSVQNSVIKNFWKKSALIAFGIGITFYFLRYDTISTQIPVIVSLYIFIEALGPSQHTLAQMRGISFCYNSSIRKNSMFEDVDFSRALKIERLEKFFFRLLLSGDILAVMPRVLRHAKIDWVGLDLLRALGFLFIIIASIGILTNSLRYPKQKGSKKSLFLTRVLLYPLRMKIWPMGLVVRAAHGTEYVVILRQMIKNSTLSTLEQKRVYKSMAWATVGYALVFMITYNEALGRNFGFTLSSSFVMCVTLLHFMVRYLHYYLDGRLFAMKNQTTREIVAPLLVQSSALKQAKSNQKAA